jgi:hypothetical protein
MTFYLIPIVILILLAVVSAVACWHRYITRDENNHH